MQALKRAAIPIGLGLLLWFLPVPTGLSVQAWHLFALMVAIIAGFISAPLPIGAVAFIGLTITVLTNTLNIKEGLSGFASGSIWLIVAAFLFSRGFIKTGLGSRIAYLLLRAIGDSTLKVAYAFTLSGLVVAPATPSSTARAGGIIYPILRSVISVLGSEPGPKARRVGAFLIMSYYQVDAVLSAMFMTAMTGNPLAVELAKKTAGIELSWGMWALAALVPGVIGIICVPLFVYLIYPPEIKRSPEVKKLAADKLVELGPITLTEMILLGVFILALLLWCSGPVTHMNPTVVGLIAVCIMLIGKVIDWKDVLNETGAWDTLIWMGVLVGMAGQLSSKGFIPWFAQTVAVSMSGMGWPLALSLLMVIYIYSQYGFASMTAHVAAMYAAFLAVAVSLGAPGYLSALLLAYSGCLCYSLTHYSSGPGPIFYNAGFVPLPTWWRIGFLTSLLHIVIWAGTGPLWWKLLGLW
ncbi:MAG: anion permease [Deltaproteobacteria bacterium HGW-Deltaproteobacteria-8]|jgi:DASS family divalent anion:Na+ symporter|nr:MAG: anion permease [Deltaproteobacteria bacterium HGW-Deltaproteobacteria-8]